MAEDFPVQLFSKTSDNVQKLFELTTRIDERVEAIQRKQADMDDRLEELARQQIDVLKEIAVLRSSTLGHRMQDVEKSVTDINSRLRSVEDSSSGMKDKWNQIASFVIQLIWVIIAAWILFQLKLQPPAVP